MRQALLQGLAGRVLLGILAVLGALRLGVGVFAWRAANALEKPQYQVLQRLPGGVELRSYAPYTVAETTIAAPDGMRSGTGTGFRTVAGYIFGKNRPRGRTPSVKMKMTAPVRVSTTEAASRPSVKMSMTSPVRAAVGGGGGIGDKVKVSFVLPSEYDVRSAPVPEDRAVSVKRVPQHTLAVRTFSGPPPADARVSAERRRVLVALDAASISVAPGEAGAETLVYGYHDPFITPSFLRRNEVAVRVDPGSVASSAAAAAA